MLERFKKLSAETKAKIVIGYVIAVLSTIQIGAMIGNKEMFLGGLLWLVMSFVGMFLTILYSL